VVVGAVRNAESERSEVLVVNVGSSSVKLRLLDAGDCVLAAQDLEDPGELREALGAFAHVPAVGHRIVHGGTRFAEAATVDDEVRAALEQLVALAPLHQPPALAALDSARSALPAAQHVACFDTAFHTTIPPAAATYAVPRDWRERLGARRYGFHGLSHAYAARRTAAILGRDPGELRLVTCHLGAGASLCAIRNGRSADTTMGFTPLEGLVMATRSGSIDPGLVLWLIGSAGMQAGEVEDALERQSGLVGLADTADMRQILDRAAGGDEDARLALAVYVHRLRGSIAAMCASLGGIDALVFTGGVGERSPRVRAAAVEGLGFLGIELDPAANERATGAGDGVISAGSSRCSIVVVRAHEDLEIAAQTRVAVAARAGV
jgi:acetate kinase